MRKTSKIQIQPTTLIGKKNQIMNLKTQQTSRTKRWLLMPLVQRLKKKLRARRNKKKLMLLSYLSKSIQLSNRTKTRVKRKKKALKKWRLVTHSWILACKSHHTKKNSLTFRRMKKKKSKNKRRNWKTMISREMKMTQMDSKPKQK